MSRSKSGLADSPLFPPPSPSVVLVDSTSHQKKQKKSNSEKSKAVLQTNSRSQADSSSKASSRKRYGLTIPPDMVQRIYRLKGHREIQQGKLVTLTALGVEAFALLLDKEGF